MNNIVIENYTAEFGESFTLRDINWIIEPNQHWVITGTNGSGKSALSAILAGAGEKLSGSISGLPERVELVSFEAQAELIDRELKKDDTDIMDVISEGTPVREILEEGKADNPDFDADLLEELIKKFKLESMLERSFRKLSTGETRKIMLIRALVNKPGLVILDEPFDGLDVDSMTMLNELLQSQIDTVPMVLVLNRFDEMPDFITHVAYTDKGQLHHTVDIKDEQAYNDLYQLLHLKTTNLEVPETDDSDRPPALNPEDPLVKLTDIKVAYGDSKVLDGESWVIEPRQHWQLSGPNGSGKTCLLNLITGDHPQCYTNDIFVFGMQRGNGETIWQIKQYIGYVSTALQWEYRVSISVRNVIISGFHDSIGMYTKSSDRQKKVADQWLKLLGMEDRADQPYNQLSFGDQRLLLIARAMVKHPTLLILDEPCLGLDDINRQLVLALIEKICNSSDTTVIYVNHHAEDQISGIKQFKQLEKLA
ncbi:molybdate ABC transporter ATP-binding protein ModF [Neptuniibacter caesariensis]|uniref:Putative anion transport protein (ABC superfamily, ATP-binding protein) n=1 Tax=Neptuniibacter caesariensis TaxID=207954 RepID=A0A7U8C5E8_NEPCE|nr:molybdate ABC transporter ATP-binding protein ModF [Neptuniibacter caesariensis]EAR60639.1 putative anion transport protein (ABC superfamily, ATP-binding protein) [Oceanospirillum sp. MED92] [Neptuniibacter caesariensis]